MPESRPSVAGTVALIVVGLMIFVPSGLCTGIVALAPFIETFIYQRGGEDISMVMMGLVIGGPFVLGGGALLWVGIKRARILMRKPSGE